MNPLAILSVISEMYQQIVDLRGENAALTAKNDELHAACAQLQEEVTQLKADPA